MNKFSNIISATLLSIMIFSLGGLLGWYIYLNKKNIASQATETRKGTYETIPQYEGNTGSTNAIILNNASSSNANTTASSSTISESQIEPYDSKTATIVTMEPDATPRLWQVTTMPVAGFNFVTSGDNIQIRYVERATGHIFDANPHTGKIVRISNTLTPKIYQAFVGPNTNIIERTVSDGIIHTIIGKINTATSSDSIGSFLETTSSGIIGNISANNSSYIYTEYSNGLYAVKRSVWGSVASTTLITTSVGNMHPILLEDGSVYIVSAPTDFAQGSAFRVSSGTMTPILRNINGLSVLPRASSTALIYSSNSNITSLFVRPSASSSSALLAIRTVADKCVWAPGKSLIAFCAVPKDTAHDNGSYLFDWHTGTIHTNDAWWRVDVSSASSTPFYAESGSGADVYSPIMDDTGTYIAYINMRDMTLWMLRLRQ